MSIELQPVRLSLFKEEDLSEPEHEQAKQELLSPKAQQNINRLLKNSSQTSFSHLSHTVIPQFLYISPTSRFYLIYSLLFLFVFYMLQVHISLTITFGLYFLSSDLSNDIFTLYYWLMVGFFVFDIGLSFFKGYYHKEKGAIVDNRGKIARRYLKFQFWVDLVSVGFLIIPYTSKAKGIQFVFLFPLLLMWIKKFSIQHQFIHTIEYHKKARNISKLIILVLDILMIGHYGACLYLKIDFVLEANNYYSKQKYYWYHLNDPYKFTQYDGHWYFYYIYAQSFSTGTLSTVAPGPYSKNLISVLFSLGVTLFFVLLTSYVAEILIEIIETNAQKRLDYEENIQLFSRFMRWKKVTLKLQVQVYNYFEILWNFKAKNQHKQEIKTMNLLPQSIKRDLILQLSFVNKFSVFELFENRDILLYELSKKIKRKFINANTSFFQSITQNDPLSDQLFRKCDSINIFVSGVVHYFTQVGVSSKNKSSSHIAFSNVDRFVGLFEFFTNQAVFFQCQTLDLCEIDTIERQNFMQAIKLTENEDKLHMLKNQVLIENKIQLINKICIFCLSQDHIQSKCPDIFISKKYQREMQKFGTGHNQRRQSKFNRDQDSNEQGHNVKPKKVYNKNIPLITEVNRRNFTHSKSMMKNLIRPNLKSIGMFQEKIAKMKEFEMCQIWRNYYPEFSLIESKLKTKI